MHLGDLGRMVRLNGASELAESMDDPVVFSRTAEGKVTGQERPLARRTWQVSLSGPPTPREVAALSGFVRGHWGLGPWIFVSDEAAVTNVLTPAATDLSAYLLGSGLDEPTASGPWEVEPEFWSGNSLIKDTDNALWFDAGRAPVLPGQAQTASCYVSGDGAAAGVSFYDAAGAGLGSYTGNTTTAGVAVRSSVTVTPPAGAVSCRVFANAATTKLTMPALTWTPELLEYSDGNGCLKAKPFGLSRRAILMLAGQKEGRYSSVQFQIQEMG